MLPVCLVLFLFLFLFLRKTKLKKQSKKKNKLPPTPPPPPPMGNIFSPSEIAQHVLYLVWRVATQPILEQDVHNLAFGVGSVRGLAHITAFNEFLHLIVSDKNKINRVKKTKEADLQEIERLKRDPTYWPPGSLHDLMPQVRGLSGSSAGSVMSLGLILGMRPHEMEVLFDPATINDIFNHFKFTTSATGTGVLSFVDVDVLRQKMQDVLESRGFSKDITFAELVKLRGIDLRIAAFNINTHEPEIFSAKSSPENIVVEAVVASSAMEKVFKPERMRSTKSKKCAAFVDGGEGDEMPFREWGDPAHTVGFYLFDQARKRTLREPFFSSLTPLEQDRIISIDVSPLGSIQYAMTDGLRRHIQNNGRKAVQYYFNTPEKSEDDDPYVLI